MMDWGEGGPRPNLKRYCARINDVYIELNDYAYFHSPSEIGDIDPRFTGRRQIIERLKNLFTDHQTPSGAYLVTGYRGAGKSSVVARALSEVGPTDTPRRRRSRYLRMVAPLMPLALFGGVFTYEPTLFLIYVLAVFLWMVLFFWDPKEPGKLAHRARIYFWDGVRRLVACLYIGEEREPRRRARMLAQDAMVILIVLLLGGLIINGKELDGFWARFGTYLIVLTLYLSASAFAGLLITAAHETGIRDRRPTLPSPEPCPETKTLKWLDRALSYFGMDEQRLEEAPGWLKVVLRGLEAALRWFNAVVYEFVDAVRRLINIVRRTGVRFWSWINNRLRYGNRFYIKINLSQDNLEEVDILRSIAKSVYLRYRKFVRDWGSDVHWKVLRLFVLVLIVGVIYNLGRVNELNQGLKHDLHLSCYFPSQGAYLLESGQYERILNDLLDGKGTKSYEAETLHLELEKAVVGTSVSDATRVGPGEHAFMHSFNEDWIGQVHWAVVMATTHLDTFVQALYLDSVRPVLSSVGTVVRDLAEASVGQLLEFVQADWKDPFEIDQLRFAGFGQGPLDYLFIFFVLAVGLLVRLVARWPIAGRVSHAVILRRLKELNEMIETQVTREQGGFPLTSSFITLSFGRRRSRTYPVLSAREIERHLIEILSMVDRISRLTVRPEFIVIFDELDKIQHHVNYTISEKEQELDQYQGREFTSVEAERARQHHILSLVSNLKHFLTTARAKFIFIAGREMFDAALADVSDRHFFMGSVFNDVLHVPSFHSDDTDGRLPDITSLTEEYLCRFLLPRRLWHRGICLRTYHQYLIDELLHGDEHAAAREKVIYELHNFVTYLSYRSNGAPKKITKALERYVERLDPALVDDDATLIAGKSPHSFYLRFDYYAQYTFGLLTYLGSPLIFALNRAIKDYGDKILVSSSFLLDHIYKFHGHGFSWRNLELLPEIVDINRAPQLRELISYIMDFLGKSAITEIASGLYDFKFNRRIVEEISFLSKVSESESAAFNFTLDESLAIKRHFNHKLMVLLKTYDEYPNVDQRNLVNSISFVRMILGDLHFYDGELDAAIIEYKEAVQALREIEAWQLRPETLVLMVRNFLKLGLAFERKKSFDSAMVTYGRVSALVVDVCENERLDECSYERTIYEGSRMIFQPLFARLQLAEKLVLGGAKASDIKAVVEDFKILVPKRRHKERHLLVSEFNCKVADVLYFKNGPTPDDTDSPEEWFEQGKVYCERESSLCGCNEDRNDLQSDGRKLPCAACHFYHSSLECLVEHALDAKDLGDANVMVIILEKLERNVAPVSARTNSLNALAGTLSGLGDTFLSCSGKNCINRDLLAGLLDLLPKPIENGKSRHQKLQSSLGKVKRTLNKVEEALVCYTLAAIIYRLAANSQSCSKELTKVLWVIREHLALQPEVRRCRKESLTCLCHQEKGGLLEDIGGKLVRTAIEESYRSHEGTHRLEIEKLKEILEVPDKARPLSDLVNLGRISINSSITEILVVFDEIKLLRFDQKKLIEIDKRCSPYSMFHSVFSRIHSLRYRAALNHHNLLALGVVEKHGAEGKGKYESVKESIRRYLECGDVKNKANQIFSGEYNYSREMTEDERRELMEFLFCDSIYCLHEILHCLVVYGTSYMASHTMRASAHSHLARWCDYYYGYIWAENDNSPEQALRVARRLENRLQDLIGQGDLVDISPSYHAEMALLHYRSAREVHSEGRAYQDLIGKMYYLNDDFADKLEHFCAALERFRINLGFIDSAILKGRKRLQETLIYKAGQYGFGGWEV